MRHSIFNIFVICLLLFFIGSFEQALAQVNLLEAGVRKTTSGDLLYKYSIEYKFKGLDAVYSPEIGELPATGIINFFSPANKIDFTSETGKVLDSVKAPEIVLSSLLSTDLSVLDLPRPEDFRYSHKTEVSPVPTGALGTEVSLVPTGALGTEVSPAPAGALGVVSGFLVSFVNLLSPDLLIHKVIPVFAAGGTSELFPKFAMIIPWQQPPNFLVTTFDILNRLDLNYKVVNEQDISSCITEYLLLHNLPRNIEGKVAFLLTYPYQLDKDVSDTKNIENISYMYQLMMDIKEKRISTKEWRMATNQDVINEAQKMRNQLIQMLQDASKKTF